MRIQIKPCLNIPTIIRALVTSLTMVFVLGSANGQETIYNFKSAPEVDVSLMQGTNGNFYGSTGSGGSNNLGTVFQMTPAGALTNLVSFTGTSGSSPTIGLVQGSDGDFYGTTGSGGNNNLGTVYKMTPAGKLTTLVSFKATNGGIPYAGLVQGSDGNFYGTTYWGGNLSLNNGDGFGTVFKMTPGGVLTTLVSFNDFNGGHPSAGLVQGSDGNFYGTTYWGGDLAAYSSIYGDGFGTVFKMTPGGVLTTLVAFDGNAGVNPSGGVIQGSDGNFYGTTTWGGSANLGTVFQMTPDGGLTTLVSFNAVNGGHPHTGLIQGSDGDFYGTTYGGDDLGVSSGNAYGTVFELKPDGTLTTLVSFTGDNGANPAAGLVQASDGNFYSTTSGGGSAGGGTLFRINTALPLSFTQQPGDHSVSPGATASFQAIALGDDPLAYQWYFNGAALENATDPNLTVTNVQLANAGNYTVVVTNFSGSITSRMAHLDVDPTFTEITTGAMVNDTGNFTRCVWGDFNNDGFLDLFVCNYGGINVLYQNNGDGTFANMNTGDPVQDIDYHTGTAGADFDNDGYLDLLVAAGIDAPSAQALKLYHNNGDDTFSQASGGVVTNQLGFFDAPTWADYDNDGFVDLFVTDDGTSTDTGGKNLLFHNNGDGTFTKVTSGAVVNDIGVGWGALWADYDNDGFDDLLVINLVNKGHNFLYHNNRDGTFTRVTTNAIATDSWFAGAQGAAWGDYDNNGLPDLYVTDSYTSGGQRNRLYHNDGNGAFTSTASPPSPSGSPLNGVVWGDYDNDGYLDLFMASSYGNNALYHNNGDGTFTQILTGDPVNNSIPGVNFNSCAWVDYDNDGFLDLFVTCAADNNTAAHNVLYHNNGNTNGWLEVKLVGTVSNRSAIGAKVRVHATIGGKTFWQMREINTGGGWNSAPLVAHFGLGDATNADIVRIEWPSGLVQEFQNVAPKQILTYTEPPRLLATAAGGVPQFSLKGGRGFQYEIDSSSDLKTWSPISTLTITNFNGIAQIVDSNPPALDHRFYRAVSH
jgi:uncharacterized repeat protein (TIGR03803 family)